MGEPTAILEQQTTPDFSDDLIIEELTSTGRIFFVDAAPCVPPPLRVTRS